MQDFRNLRVWRNAHQVALATYALTRSFPTEEQYGLTAQLRRAAISTAANIAEGSSRRGDKDFARFLQIALASATEVEYLLLLARDLDLSEPQDSEPLSAAVVELKRMLAALMRRLRSRNPPRA